MMKKTKTFQSFNYLSNIVADVDRLQRMQEIKEILALLLLLLFFEIRHVCAFSLLISWFRLVTSDRTSSNTWFKHHLQLIHAFLQTTM